jgi:hypothetical protein
MPPIGLLVYRSILILILGFAVVALWNIFTRRIPLNGLLQDNNSDFSPGRVQMLVVTLMAAMQYIFQVIQNPTGFPEIPQTWLAALGASHGIYLGGKAYTILGGRSKQP